MISHRPKHLLADAAYNKLPKAPLSLNWDFIPELVRVVMLDLSGIQPPTKEMTVAAGGTLQDKPSEGEIKLFKDRGTRFQLISVVLSLIPGGEDGVTQFNPFAVTLIPASKGGKVETVDVDFVANIDVATWLEQDPMYTGYDPFKGDWSMFGIMPGYLDGERKGFFDEIGVIVDQFFLATSTGSDEILMMDLRMPSEEATARYGDYRKKLFFAPFTEVKSRRIWGAESAIELFLLQALAKEKLFPECQMLILNDGATMPSLYHVWRDPKFRNAGDVITSVDLYFPKERIAVFCDGGTHSRREKKLKDAAINAKLEALGIQPLRILSSEIKSDVERSVSRIKDMLSGDASEESGAKLVSR